MNTFLSGVAVLLSVIALAGAGFALTQMFQLQQSFRELNDFVQSSPTVSETESDQQANTEIQPGQFVQYAFKDRAQVELLSVKRIQNPDDGQRNIVNVQVRVRNLKGGVTHIISPDQTIARNPKTNERLRILWLCDYVVDKAAREQARRDGTEIDRSGRIARSTSSITMGLVKRGSSVDGYVWLLIPEEVQTIDLIVPKTAIFEKVPISE